MTGGICSGPTSRTTSRPEQSGICTSSRIRSGIVVEMARIASCPDAHSPMISTSGKAERVLRKPLRIKGSSSTTNRRSLLIGYDSHVLGCEAKWNGHLYLRASFRQTVYREGMLFGIHVFQPFTCRCQTDPQVHLVFDW